MISTERTDLKMKHVKIHFTGQKHKMFVNVRHRTLTRDQEYYKINKKNDHNATISQYSPQALLNFVINFITFAGKLCRHFSLLFAMIYTSIYQILKI